MRALCAATLALLLALPLLVFAPAAPAHGEDPGLRVVVVHASMQNTDPMGAQRRDFLRELDRGADVLTFTEADRLMAHGWARRAARTAGYRLVGHGQEAIAVSVALGVVVRHGFRLVLHGVSGQYPNRGVLWATVHLEGSGNALAVLATHLNTHGLYSRVRDAGNRRILRVAGRIARAHARLGQLVVGGVDTNYPLPQGHPLHRTGLSMSWRPAGHYAPTLGRMTYDAVLFRPAKRLRVQSVTALRGKRAKDHKSVRTIFRVFG